MVDPMNVSSSVSLSQRYPLLSIYSSHLPLRISLAMNVRFLFLTPNHLILNLYYSGHFINARYYYYLLLFCVLFILLIVFVSVFCLFHLNFIVCFCCHYYYYYLEFRALLYYVLHLKNNYCIL